MSTEVRKCQNCQSEFQIESEDFQFYEKIKVPPPTFCSECRMQRRMAWRNERSLYTRKCAFSGKNVVSCFAPDTPVTVYDRDIWWSDAWDPLVFGQEYDFKKSFFAQFSELLKKTPLPSLFNGETTNSTYTNHIGWTKDCYLIFASWDDENCAYANKLSFSKDSFDALASNHCELSYEAVQSSKIYQCGFVQNCEACNNSFFLYNCKGCSYCFGCVNLRNKSYYIFNKPYSKEEYFKELKRLNMGSCQSLSQIKEKFNDLKKNSIHRFAYLSNVQNVTGDNLFNVADSKECFDLIDDVRNCKFVVNGGFKMTDTYDGYGIGLTELCYESVDVGLESSRQLFGIVTWRGHSTMYTYNCHNCVDCFGCVGLRNKQYCILNRQYSKEEYEKLVPEIVKHINEMPYVDQRDRAYKYGEFFPSELSPFAYNETIAQEYFPLTKEDAETMGFRWRDPETRHYAITKGQNSLPDHINDVSDSILNEVIGCAHGGECNEQCTTAFKIIPAELQFYKRMNLALPRLCSNCRHYQRLKQRNPLKLWHRKCTCAGAKSENSVYANTVNHFHGGEHCPNEFETSYAPDRKEIVYCEQCYQAEVV